jgi:hypothetical protein
MFGDDALLKKQWRLIRRILRRKSFDWFYGETLECLLPVLADGFLSGQNE